MYYEKIVVSNLLFLKLFNKEEIQLLIKKKYNYFIYDSNQIIKIHIYLSSKIGFAHAAPDAPQLQRVGRCARHHAMFHREQLPYGAPPTPAADNGRRARARRLQLQTTRGPEPEPTRALRTAADASSQTPQNFVHSGNTNEYFNI